MAESVSDTVVSYILAKAQILVAYPCWQRFQVLKKCFLLLEMKGKENIKSQIRLAEYSNRMR